MEINVPKENLVTVARAFLFDVDGVLTHPAEKRTTQKELIDAIVQRIELGEVVTLNTGRSISWMMGRVIKPIEHAVSDKSKLSNFLAIGEKGGAWVDFNNGSWQTHIDESISMPESLKQRIRKLIDTEFSDLMFYDESKLTMISTEMKDGENVKLYTARQEILERRMREILDSPEYRDLNLRTDPTTIATDIQNVHVGKHLGARRIADWMKEQRINPKQVIAIGDSQSDTEMAEELQDEYDVEFVFVGDEGKLNRSKLHCPVVITEKKFEEGTLEYLKSLSFLSSFS